MRSLSPGLEFGHATLSHASSFACPLLLNKRCQANRIILCQIVSINKFLDNDKLLVITNLNVTHMTGLSAEALITERF